MELKKQKTETLWEIRPQANNFVRLVSGISCLFYPKALIRQFLDGMKVDS
ncbi:hypothetical protein [Algoriphagus marinus]|nr:hypothetical protein [Algoriphagus marinus]